MIALDENCAPFLEPVDWKELELNDYPDVIKNPMDIGTLKQNITDGVNKTFESVFADLQLVWENCKTYNFNHDMYKLAESMERVAKREIQKFLAQHSLVVELPSPTKMLKKRSSRMAGRPSLGALSRQASMAEKKKGPGTSID